MKKGVLAALQLIFFQCLTFALVSEPTRLHEGEALLERQEIERISKCVDNGRVVLGCRGVGLFSEFFGALNWLTWSERESIALKVFWGGEQFLYSNDEENHWHDFFWPFWGEATFFDIEKIAYFYWARRSMVVFLRRGYAFNFYRATGCDLVKRYIRVKSDIIEEVDAFCRDFFWIRMS